MFQVSRHGLPETVLPEPLARRQPSEGWRRAEASLPLPKPDPDAPQAPHRDPQTVRNRWSGLRLRGPQADQPVEGV